MSALEINELRQTIGQLRRCVNALRAEYGDVSPVRRLENDLDRLEIDAGDMAESPPPEVRRAQRDVIYVPDSKSDESAWMGAQDEGLGFHSRERTK